MRVTVSDNLSGLLLLLHALRDEGRSPVVFERRWYETNKANGRAAELDGVDHVLVEEDTWQAWVAYRSETP